MGWINDGKIKIFLSDVDDGNMLFANGQDEINRQVAKNRKKFFEKCIIDSSHLVNLKAVHGNKIFLVGEKDLGKGALDNDTRITGIDGLLSDIPDSCLMITGADCFPILLYDETMGVVGAAHAGWKGVINNIAGELIKAAKDNFGSDAKNIKIWIGPGIKSCHFEVKNEVLELFQTKEPNCVLKKENGYFVDLQAILKKQLLISGIFEQNIIVHNACTFCDLKYFSNRRDKKQFLEAFAAIISFK